MSQSSNMAGQQSGRILIHECDMNDDVHIIGGGKIINNELGGI